jgi:CDP-4-dehydro-6-deoxyglucose reductase, E1
MLEEKNQIFELAKQYYNKKWPKKEFVPGSTYIPVSGKVFDEKDLISLLDSSLDFWLTTGRFAESFESKFAEKQMAKYAMITNSGSSANLLAISALTSPLLKEKQLKPGDEVISAAAGFPTTVNPIIQNGLTPVFIDSEIPSYNPDMSYLEKAITPKTKAIIFAHTLGNPFDLTTVVEIAKKYNLWLIEDCCDAIGSTYLDKQVGTFGHISTYSFYPAHHITMGEGGAITTNNLLLKKIIMSLRDWGRDCWCETGCDNTCKSRFTQKHGDLPYGFDHKYVYSHIGYNLKATDMQAAVGVTQLDKLDGFNTSRRNNFKYLYNKLEELQEFFILPQATKGSDPSWFGFPITVGNKRKELVEYLEDHKIGTRMIFGGNLSKQPAYLSTNLQVRSPLTVADKIMSQSFWIGVFPGITFEMLDYMADTLKNAITELSLKPQALEEANLI